MKYLNLFVLLVLCNGSVVVAQNNTIKRSSSKAGFIFPVQLDTTITAFKFVEMRNTGFLYALRGSKDLLGPKQKSGYIFMLDSTIKKVKDAWLYLDIICEGLEKPKDLIKVTDVKKEWSTINEASAYIVRFALTLKNDVHCTAYTASLYKDNRTVIFIGFDYDNEKYFDKYKHTVESIKF